jgi:hypothetical protein
MYGINNVKPLNKYLKKLTHKMEAFYFSKTLKTVCWSTRRDIAHYVNVHKADFFQKLDLVDCNNREDHCINFKSRRAEFCSGARNNIVI